MAPPCLAQINIARLRAPIDHPSVVPFVDALDRINRLAEESPGFVWRLQTEAGNATDIQAFDDPLMIVNMSVWRSVEDLRAYAYRSEHVAFFRRRAEWFHRLDGPAVALWWVADGDRPTPAEGRTRIEHLAAHGPSAFAFTFGRIFEPDLPAA